MALKFTPVFEGPLGKGSLRVVDIELDDDYGAPEAFTADAVGFHHGSKLHSAKVLSTTGFGSKEARIVQPSTALPQEMCLEVVDPAGNNAITGPTGFEITTGGSATARNSIAFNYYVDGKWETQLAIGNFSLTATTHDITADTTVQERVYIAQVATGGARTFKASPVATGLGNAVIPRPDAGNVVAGILRVSVDAAGSDFIADTTALDAAGYTFAFTSTAHLAGVDEAEFASGTNFSGLTVRAEFVGQ